MRFIHSREGHNNNNNYIINKSSVISLERDTRIQSHNLQNPSKN
jgi:hypothetical protein